VTIYICMYVDRYTSYTHIHTQSCSTGREGVGFTGRGGRVVCLEGDYIYVCYVCIYTSYAHIHTQSYSTGHARQCFTGRGGRVVSSEDQL